MVQTLTEIRAMLDAHGLHPKHRFGQNFLHDHNQLRKIIEAADITAGDVVLEVGPGTGALSEWLLEAGAHVVAVEIDADLQPVLEDRLSSRFGERFVLCMTDVLASKHELSPVVLDALRSMGGGTMPPFKLIANLPYNVASPLLLNLACDVPQMSRAVVMIQREVADRLIADPGSKTYGPLGIMLQVTCVTDIVSTLPPECFWPRPKVASAVVRIVRREKPLTDDLPRFSRVVHEVFAQRRKQIGSLLGRDRHWPAGIEPNMRAETLTVEQLIELAAAVG